ncbi:hypothetical protein KRM28CT15_26570 [Krasilnikovia sp. M28-CT-15]
MPRPTGRSGTKNKVKIVDRFTSTCRADTPHTSHTLGLEESGRSRVRNPKSTNIASATEGEAPALRLPAEASLQNVSTLAEQARAAIAAAPRLQHVTELAGACRGQRNGYRHHHEAPEQAVKHGELLGTRRLLLPMCPADLEAKHLEALHVPVTAEIRY